MEEYEPEISSYEYDEEDEFEPEYEDVQTTGWKDKLAAWKAKLKGEHTEAAAAHTEATAVQTEAEGWKDKLAAWKAKLKGEHTEAAAAHTEVAAVQTKVRGPKRNAKIREETAVQISKPNRFSSKPRDESEEVQLREQGWRDKFNEWKAKA